MTDTKMKSVPKVRFEGFTDDWEQRKLNDVAEFSKGSGFSKRDLRNDGQPIILYGRMYTQYETVIKDVDTYVASGSEGVISQGSEVIVPGSGETAEDISRASVVDRAGVLLGGDINVIMPDTEVDSEFLALSISNGEPKKDLVRRAQGKSVVHLHNSDLQQVIIKFPGLEEQHEISGFIAKLESTIALHQRKHDSLLKLKQAYLQKMFPKNGQKTPELRFGGFTDDWEQRKLGDLVNVDTGSRNHQDAVQGGRYPFYVRSENIEALDEYDFDETAILVPGDGRIGEIFHFVQGKFALHQRVYKLDGFTGVMPEFLIQLLRHGFRKHALRMNAQGTVPSLRKPVFTEWQVLIPNTKEQKPISYLLRCLDKTIALHQQQLDNLKQLKKWALQNLFV